MSCWRSCQDQSVAASWIKCNIADTVKRILYFVAMNMFDASLECHLTVTPRIDHPPDQYLPNESLSAIESYSVLFDRASHNFSASSEISFSDDTKQGIDRYKCPPARSTTILADNNNRQNKQLHFDISHPQLTDDEDDENLPNRLGTLNIQPELKKYSWITSTCVKKSYSLNPRNNSPKEADEKNSVPQTLTLSINTQEPNNDERTPALELKVKNAK
ncbi:unnamed protein product, partial [Didymodactylos carnosus]